MYKVVYNSCYGGFSLSKKAVQRLAELGSEEAVQALKDDPNNSFGYSLYDYNSYKSIARHDKRLVQVVEELGDEANGRCSKLRIEEISSRTYRISEYDGLETVKTAHDLEDWIIID